MSSLSYGLSHHSQLFSLTFASSRLCVSFSPKLFHTDIQRRNAERQRRERHVAQARGTQLVAQGRPLRELADALRQVAIRLLPFLLAAQPAADLRQHVMKVTVIDGAD